MHRACVEDPLRNYRGLLRSCKFGRTYPQVSLGHTQTVCRGALEVFNLRIKCFSCSHFTVKALLSSDFMTSLLMSCCPSVSHSYRESKVTVITQTVFTDVRFLLSVVCRFQTHLCNLSAFLGREYLWAINKLAAGELYTRKRLYPPQVVFVFLVENSKCEIGD